MNAQILPYNGTSGWAGSKASQERQMFLDETGETGKRQKAVVDELKALKNYGATWREIGIALNLHHGQASGVLSVLHSAGIISRLEQKRNRCSVYVLNDYVNGRKTSAPSKTKAGSDKSKLDRIKQLHAETEFSEITNTIYCKECQYPYPCDTAKILGE